jgi:hypothetical protein
VDTELADGVVLQQRRARWSMPRAAQTGHAIFFPLQEEDQRRDDVKPGNVDRVGPVRRKRTVPAHGGATEGKP